MGSCLMLALISVDGLFVFAKVAIGLGLVIFVHELGHFLVAKLCGVKCEKFYVGFDVPIRIGPLALPRTLGKFQWGETEYGIGIIPLGGYVKMLGQDDNPANAAKEAERIRVAKQAQSESVDQAGSGSAAGAETEDIVASQDTSESETGRHAQDGNEQDTPFVLDPRSYPAKSVPRRMAIISAGVIMNVMFAAIFATIAFRMGFWYTPCEIGGTSPGYPAWQAGVRSGDRIVRLGEDDELDEQLRFDRDLRGKVMLSEKNKTIKIQIQRGEERHWIELRPTVATSDQHSKAIGVYPTHTTDLFSKSPVFEGTVAAQAEPALQGKDKFIAIDGQPVKDGLQLQTMLANAVNKDIVVTIERVIDDDANGGTATQRIDVSVKRRPMRTLGLKMKMGPVTALRTESPAAVAGMRVGDLIKSVDGQPVQDALTFPERLRRMVGETVEFEVLRNGDPVSLTVTLATPESYFQLPQVGCPLVAEALGVVYTVAGKVVGVDPGSPADQAGIQERDEIVQAEFVPAEGQRHNAKKRGTPLEPVELNTTELNWPFIHLQMQETLPETKLKLTYRRGSQDLKTITLAHVDSDQWYMANRGFRFQYKSEWLQISPWLRAWSMGLRQTQEDLMMVVTVLQRIATGQISLFNLGGPGTIVAAAGSEASVGTGRLLLFLTLLSTNLAVINFLPIPVLDGGHMMFLIAEGIRGKPVDEKLQFQLTVLGLVFILSLMVFVIGLDVFRFSQWL